MKKTLLIMAICSILTAANAQLIKEAEVPTSVKASFAKMFPDVKDVKWGKEKNQYKACYTHGQHKGFVLFDATGKWSERETSIDIRQLPEKIKKYMREHYKQQPWKSASKVIKATSETQFKIEISAKDILFSKEGVFIKEG